MNTPTPYAFIIREGCPTQVIPMSSRDGGLPFNERRSSFDHLWFLMEAYACSGFFVGLQVGGNSRTNWYPDLGLDYTICATLAPDDPEFSTFGMPEGVLERPRVILTACDPHNLTHQVLLLTAVPYVEDENPIVSAYVTLKKIEVTR